MCRPISGDHKLFTAHVNFVMPACVKLSALTRSSNVTLNEKYYVGPCSIM